MFQRNLAGNDEAAFLAQLYTNKPVSQPLASQPAISTPEYTTTFQPCSASTRVKPPPPTNAPGARDLI